MGTRRAQDKLAQNFKRTQYNFIMNELDLALTFCDIAMTSGDTSKRKRNIENAQRAYDAANHFLNEGSLPDGVGATVRQKVLALKGMLARIRKSEDR